MVESHGTSKGFAGRLGSKIGHAIVRLYALMILLLVLWSGYAAVAYLVRMVFTPARTPEQFVQRADTLQATLLLEGEARAQAIASARRPVGHYHDVERWLQPDTHNGCAIAGCHGPLPHVKRKDVRAFANFHTTFLTCGVCHDAEMHAPMAAVWVDVATVRRQAPPAMLRLTNVLETKREQVQSQPASIHGEIVALLREANGVAGSPQLDYLLVQIDTSEPGSPVWRTAVANLAAELPNHARGEYGARIAPEARVAELQEQQGRLATLAGEYTDAREGSPERARLHKQIHSRVLARPEACLSCHGGEPARLDDAALGYSPQRATALRASPIARLIQQIREGQPFYLPKMMEEGNTR